jgi:hypothetical protein
MPGVDVVTIATDLDQVDARRHESDQKPREDDRFARIDDSPVTPNVSVLSN